jgi:hypothetical protein
MRQKVKNGLRAWRWGAFVFAVLPWTTIVAADDLPLAAGASAMLRRLCLDCHGKDLAEARINLEQMLAAPDFGRGFKEWEKVAAMLRSGKMPPENETQPTSAERNSAIAAIEESLQTYIRRHAGDPGAVVLRRLTSAEFDYTIEDLTRLDLRLARRFVSDAVGGEGFTNVGGAQFVEDSTLEQYLEAAKNVADHAVIGVRPLTFFEHPGETGRELSAITHIKELYHRTGFRTAAGEGAKPFGLDLYPRAMFVAWQFRHRQALGLGDASLEKLARNEGMSVRLCEHVWKVLNAPATSFPLSVIVGQWQSLPEPGSATANEAEIRAACDRIAGEMRQWQSILAAAAGDEEEAAVLTEGEVDIRPQHAFQADLDWDDGAKFADIQFSVSSASKQPAAGAIVVWRTPRIRFVHADNRRGETIPLASFLSPETIAGLKFGDHPSAGTIEEGDFVLSGERKAPIRILIPDGMKAARLYVDVELDTQHGADAIVRCRISDGDVASETAAEVGDSSTLLGNPASPAVTEWRAGVAEFARLLPEVSHREPTPSDRDPIPPPFDATYNMPERNHFHTAIKYHRDDHFLVTHVLDDATRHELDQAWTDLLTSFEYHDANLRFAAKKYAVELGEKQIAEIDAADIDRFPADVRPFVQRLCDEYREMQQRLQVAEAERVADVLQFAERAWRRPLTTDERQRVRDFYATLRHESALTHHEAIRATLVRILVAPAFLYRAESFESLEKQAVAGGLTIRPTEESRVAQLSDWELASRLSYLVWSSLPDEELSQAASAGKLSDPTELARQTRRMLRDPKARRLATEFFGQWLGFYRFDEYRGIDGKRFPEFNDALKVAMYDEAISFFAHIIREDRPVGEILFANYSFLNGPLARHYGVDDAGLLDTQHKHVSFADDQHRGGLLGMAAVLTTTSAPLRTSAVKRGDWVLRRVLGTPVPPPPADAGSIAADDAGKDGLTVRQRLEAHRTDKACVNCHARIDPLGFALEHYDPLGRWRDEYRDGQGIDSASVLNDGTVIEGLDDLKQYLQRQQPQFERNLSTKLLGYALGRAELSSDRPLIEEMLANLKNDGRFADLVVRIVISKQFRYRKW